MCRRRSVPGLQIVNTGNSQNFSIINGAMSSTVTVTFSVTARQRGRVHHSGADGGCERPAAFHPAAEIDRDQGQRAVRRRRQFRQRSRVPETVVVRKKKIYVGESAGRAAGTFFRDDVQNFGNFQLTSTPADGFSAGKIAEVQNQRRRVQVGNRIYTVIPSPSR